MPEVWYRSILASIPQYQRSGVWKEPPPELISSSLAYPTDLCRSAAGPLGFFLTTFALPAWLMLVYWMVIQFFGGLQSIGAAGGVAFWAHIGGFVAGMVLIKLFSRRDYLEEHGSHHWHPQRIGWRGSRWEV